MKGWTLLKQKLATGYISGLVPFPNDHTAHFSGNSFNVILASRTELSNWTLPQKLANKILYIIFPVFHKI
jgi:hypothetical protein